MVMIINCAIEMKTQPINKLTISEIEIKFTPPPSSLSFRHRHHQQCITISITNTINSTSTSTSPRYCHHQIHRYHQIHLDHHFHRHHHIPLPSSLHIIISIAIIISITIIICPSLLTFPSSSSSPSTPWTTLPSLCHCHHHLHRQHLYHHLHLTTLPSSTFPSLSSLPPHPSPLSSSWLYSVISHHHYYRPSSLPPPPPPYPSSSSSSNILPPHLELKVLIEGSKSAGAVDTVISSHWELVWNQSNDGSANWSSHNGRLESKACTMSVVNLGWGRNKQENDVNGAGSRPKGDDSDRDGPENGGMNLQGWDLGSWQPVRLNSLQEKRKQPFCFRATLSSNIRTTLGE